MRLLTKFFALLLVPASCFAASESRPNIVFILADDLGYGDLACYGNSSVKTPNLDRLAREGALFRQHYSNGPECSPTRTAFLTGRYQQRAGGLECAIGTGNVGRYDDAIRLAAMHQLGLPADQTVIPGSLRQAGYVCGIFGKWHLGYEPQFNPMEHGWDEFTGYLGGNVHYFNHRETSDLHVLFRGRLPVHREGYMTQLITDDAINFVEGNCHTPFFLYVSHECPHFPFQTPKDVDRQVTAENWMDIPAGAYVAMIENLDAEVGRLLTVLQTNGLTENTVVVFASDNGGFEGASSMGNLRGAKGTTFEGGIRVPLIVRWPGKIPNGTISNQVCTTFDLTRSFLNIAGVDNISTLEGDDIIGHVVASKADYSRTLYWRGKRGDRTWAAVRHGDQKLVQDRNGGEIQEWLFDLNADPEESAALAAPDVAAELRRMLSNWEVDVQFVR